MNTDNISKTYEKEDEKKEEGTNSLLAYVPLKHYLTDSKQGCAGYHVMQSQIINILLVGRSQAGKSTLLATLLNPQQAVQGRGYSVTKEPQNKVFILNDEHNSTSYAINVIDTPGLREKRINLQTRNDADLVTLAHNYIAKQVTYLNIVIYVTAAKRTCELDTEAFQYIREYLGNEFESNSLLVLSHCEEIPKITFDQLIDDMKTFPETNEIINYCKLGVLPYGTMNADYLALADEDDDESRAEKEKRNAKRVRDTLMKIEKMRQDLFLAIIKSANRPRSISQLEGLKKIVAEQERRTLNAALNAAKEKWNKERNDEIQQIKMQNAAEQEEKSRNAAELSKQIELQNKKFIEEMKTNQEEIKRYEVELSKQNELLNKKFQEEMKNKLEEEEKRYKALLTNDNELLSAEFHEKIRRIKDEEKKEYANQLQEELRKQQENFEKRLVDLSEEKGRLYAEQQAKAAQEREKQMSIKLEELREDRERLHAELLAKEAKENKPQLTVEEIQQEVTRLHNEQLKKGWDQNLAIELEHEKALLNIETQVKERKKQMADQFERLYQENTRKYAKQLAKEMHEKERQMADKYEKSRQDMEYYYEQRLAEERNRQYKDIAMPQSERYRTNSEFERKQEKRQQHEDKTFLTKCKGFLFGNKSET